ncbi:twin-arginine translocation signal domain-containing protein [Streptosporangium lutulentum]|uniref:twin-arginine translocation signal domain-containing protein n=1 Tax=Streptosporangium lutulentum TaxID=1461250 RepID=UPI00352099A8
MTVNDRGRDSAPSSEDLPSAGDETTPPSASRRAGARRPGRRTFIGLAAAGAAGLGGAVTLPPYLTSPSTSPPPAAPPPRRRSPSLTPGFVAACPCRSHSRIRVERFEAHVACCGVNRPASVETDGRDENE